MQLKERLYLVEDKSKAVHSNNPSGRFLLGKKGGTITEEQAEFYGIINGLLVDGASVAEQIVEVPKLKPAPLTLDEALESDLTQFTVKYLKEIAEEVGIDIPKKIKKQKLVELIEQSMEEGDELENEDIEDEPDKPKDPEAEPVPTVENVEQDKPPEQIVPPEVKRTGLGLVINKLKGRDK